jgi:hypothetical protein
MNPPPLRGSLASLGAGYCQAVRRITIMTEPQERGVIGEIREDGFPVVFKFVDELPSAETHGRFGWLAVLSWKYDGRQRNGMPPEEINLGMLDLEHAVEGLEQEGYCRHAYSRTGNGLKELVYYISDRDQFMGAFNGALRDQPPYPIEITFYEDRGWEDFRKILQMFRQAK